MHKVILPAVRQIGFQGSQQTGRATVWSDVDGGETEVVEPVEEAALRPHQAPQERRSSETRANAQALHLGIAAQMWSTQPSGEEPLVLPLPPIARMAARYASTAHGLDQTTSMGFARTA